MTAVRTARALAMVGASLALTALFGCGGDSNKATLSGKVTYKGAPVPGGTLTLYPESGPAYPISLHADGTFSVSDVPVGPMGVGIDTGGPAAAASAGPGMSNLPPHVDVPLKYKDPKTSHLTWDVKGGHNTKEFDLSD